MKKYSIGQKISAEQAMAISIEEAKKGLGWVSPNPPVGCTIVDKNHCFLSSAYHKAYGKDHAEIEALKKIKDKKKLIGAHLYVTLEPCNHKGKTPPCTQTLIKHSFDTIYYGQKDLNPKVNGKGLKEIKSKGIKIKKYKSFEKNIQDLYRIFNYNMIHKKSFISLKVASTLDGMMALSDGSSQWISSQSSRDYVSTLRAHHDAVLIGVGTFLEDNPKLNIRNPFFHKKHNHVVILDPHGDCLDLLEDSKIAQCRESSKIIVVTKQSFFDKKAAACKKTKKKNDRLQQPFSCKELPLHKKINPRCEQKKIACAQQSLEKIKLLTCDWDISKNQFDLSDLKSILYLSANLNSVLVEGGAHTFSCFVSQEEANLLYQFVNPSLVGGVNGLSWLQALKISRLDQKKELNLLEFYQLDEDILFKMKFKKQEL